VSGSDLDLGGETRLRDVYWAPLEGPGCEHLRLETGRDGASADSVILLCRDGAALRCRYRLDTDPGWRLRALTLELLDREEGDTPTRVELEADGAGKWRVDGAAEPALDGCLDVDVQVTPLTNTLPIRRLGLAEGESADIRVAYVPVPGLDPRPAEQRYTCLKPLGPDGGRYLYEGLFRGFAAELAVDSDGLVIDYPETFRRLWPT
jgi:hypothetical protein